MISIRQLKDLRTYFAHHGNFKAPEFAQVIQRRSYSLRKGLTQTTVSSLKTTGYHK